MPEGDHLPPLGTNVERGKKIQKTKSYERKSQAAARRSRLAGLAIQCGQTSPHPKNCPRVHRP